jgi:hypothetical protein
MRASRRYLLNIFILYIQAIIDGLKGVESEKLDLVLT